MLEHPLFTQQKSSQRNIKPGDRLYRRRDPSESVGSGYSSETRYKPSGGTVGPEDDRSRISRILGISETASLPFPTSRSVPTIFRTMYLKNDRPRTVILDFLIRRLTTQLRGMDHANHVPPAVVFLGAGRRRK